VNKRVIGRRGQTIHQYTCSTKPKEEKKWEKRK